MGHYFSILFPLGLAGFDPAPVFIALYFLAHNPGRGGRRTVAGFSLFLLVGVAAWGLLLSLVFGDAITKVPWHRLLELLLHAGIWTVLGKLVIGLVLLFYGGLSLRAKLPAGSGVGEQVPQKSRSATGLYLFGLVFILVVTTDVPFAAYVGLSAHQPLWAQLLGLLGWSLIAQFPLVGLLGAVLTGREAVFAHWLEIAQSRFGVIFTFALPALALVLGAALMLDALFYLLVRLVI